MKARASKPSRSLNALAQFYVENLMQRPFLRELNNLCPPLTLDSRAPFFFISMQQIQDSYRFDKQTDLPHPEASTKLNINCRGLWGELQRGQIL